MQVKDNYRYTVYWSDDDQEWVGRCDAFPSLSWLAPDPVGALAGIRKLVADGVEALESLGRRVPAATREERNPLTEQLEASVGKVPRVEQPTIAQASRRSIHVRGRRWRRKVIS